MRHRPQDAESLAERVSQACAGEVHGEDLPTVALAHLYLAATAAAHGGLVVGEFLSAAMRDYWAASDSTLPARPGFRLVAGASLSPATILAMKTFWEEYKCSNPDCDVEHFRWCDHETQEIIGAIHLSRASFIDGRPAAVATALYRGQVVGEFRGKEAAMIRLARVHESGGLPPNAELGSFLNQIKGLLSSLVETRGGPRPPVS